MRVWVLAEAFCLDCDGYGPHNSMAPWSLACRDRRVCLRELRNAVAEHVMANYEGAADPARPETFDEVSRRIDADIEEVLSKPTKLARGKWQYAYHAGDREVVWRVYPCEVMGT